MANLGDLTYYANRSLGGIGAEEVNSERGRNALSAAQQFDKNAQYRPSYGSDGQLLGYSLYFDPAKMPGVTGEGHLGGTNVDGGDYAGGSAPIARFSTVQDRMNLANPDAVYDSPVYGKVTDNRNIYDKPDLFSTLAPLAVGAFGMLAPLAFGAAGLGMGAGASAAIGGANGGLAATEGGISGLSGTAPSWVVNAVKQIPSMGRSAADGNFNPLSLIPMAGGAAGLPSWVTSGATTIGNLAQGGKLNFNPVQLALQATSAFGRGKGG